MAGMRGRRALLLVGILLLVLVAGGVAWRQSREVAGEGTPQRVGAMIDTPPPDATLAALGRDAPAVTTGSPIAASTEDAEADSPEPIDPAPRPAGWPADAPTVLCRVEIVDAVTGAPIDRRWRLPLPSSAGPPPPAPGEPARPVVEEPPRPPEYDGRERGPTDAAALLRFGSWNARIRCYPRIQDDDEYVLWDDAWSGIDGFPTVAAGVEEVRVRLPLRRALTLELRVLGPSGEPARGARLTRLRVDGRWLPSHQELVDEEGVARITGVPFVPGARLESDVAWTPPPDGRSLQHADPPRGTVPVEFPLDVQIPTSVPAPWRVTVRLTDATEVRETVPAFGSGDRPHGLDCDLDSPADDLPRGSVLVRAIGWDGRPVVKRPIISWRYGEATDALGVARFGDLPVGDRPFTLVSVDRLFAGATARVVAGEETTVTLLEPQGGRLEVLVVDEGRRPCPTARLAILAASKPAWFDVEGGVQRLDPFTDENGRRSIARVAPGTALVRAVAAGGRTAEAEIEVQDGVTRSLTLVVREPKASDADAK
jgi:hypothetical protein